MKIVLTNATTGLHTPHRKNITAFLSKEKAESVRDFLQTEEYKQEIGNKEEYDHFHIEEINFDPEL